MFFLKNVEMQLIFLLCVISLIVQVDMHMFSFLYISLIKAMSEEKQRFLH